MWIEMQLQKTTVVQLEEMQQKFLKGVQQLELQVLRKGHKETA